MSYYFLHEERKIPTLLAYLLIALFTIGLATLLRSLSIQPITRAAPLLVPKQLIISNVTNSSATIAIEFPQKTIVSVTYHPKGETRSLIAFDERDSRGQQQRLIHLVRLVNLSPRTTYEFELLINGKSFNGSGTYSFTTFSNDDVYGNQPPLFGAVVHSNLEPLQGVLVQLRFPEINATQTYTAISNSSGNWIISVPIVTSNQGERVQIDSSDKVELRFTNGTTRSLVTARVEQTAPLKTIVLGKQYNLDTTDSVLGAAESSPLQKNLQILFPKDRSAVPSRFIRVRGIAKPNSSLSIQLTPGRTTDTVSVDSTGAWSYQNTIPLLTGTYTLTATSTTEHTSTQILFTVTKEGERVLGDATASATITTTPPVISTPPITNTPSALPTSTIPTTGFNTNLLIITASSLSLLGMVLLLY